ncbi:MAG: cytochrome c biogenesis protein CcsA [Thermoguttaceae bacterium]
MNDAGHGTKAARSDHHIPTLWQALLRPLRLLASLRLAVVLIVVYAAALVWATTVEKNHGAEAARHDVYGTRWFVVFHALLAVNILAALAARLPWRWRHAGFVAAHAGILVLLAGCLLTWWRGVEGQLPVLEGQAAYRVEPADEDSRGFDLGFQIALREFHRRLNPGTATASQYSSLVDFLDRSQPPKKLRENVLIRLNGPVDFTDPESGKTYRIFQSGFSGPATPGDEAFDKLIGNDRGRDHVYLSRLSVSYDPGRGLKYLGSLLVVLGMIVVYGQCCRRRGTRSDTQSHNRDPADRGACHDGSRMPRGLTAPGLFLAAMLSLVGSSYGSEPNSLDWTAWRRLPALAEGRVAPLDTVARETVEAICGRRDPTLAVGDAPPRRFAAAELVFAWLADPDRWEDVPFLPADDVALRRDVLGRTTENTDGRRPEWLSPAEVERATSDDAFSQRLAKLEQQARDQGQEFRSTAVFKKTKRLMDAYGKYRSLTFCMGRHRDLPWRFRARLESARAALFRLASDPQAAKRISGDPQVRQLLIQSVQSYQQLTAELKDGPFDRKKLEPLAADYQRLAGRLAAALPVHNDRPLAALAADVDRQAAELHLALYDNGDGLRLSPALDAASLDANRATDEDASPWLSLPAMLHGSDELLAAYPARELEAVRRAWTAARSAYLDRNANRFAEAMGQFAADIRQFGERTAPLRAKLSIAHRDQAAIDATAYPRPGSTDTEVVYNRLDPFFWAWVVGAAAALPLLAAVGRWRATPFWLGVALLIFGQMFTLAGLGLRSYITGLAPLTGMFESVVVVSLFVALLAVWLTLWPLGSRAIGIAPRRLAGEGTDVLERRPFALAGAIISSVAMLLAYYAPAAVMHRNIGSATPILRDNFWLIVHVTTIMMSYAAAAMAMLLGNLALGYYLFGRYTKPARRPPEACKQLAGFAYTAIQVTVVLLAAGTILGALWADYAWGRFWAWDPKETWALVSLLVYVAFLHARHAGWSGDFGMCLTAVLGFSAILFTWYGVNFLISSGMHSYGSGAARAWPILLAALVQLSFLVAAAVRRGIKPAGG